MRHAFAGASIGTLPGAPAAASGGANENCGVLPGKLVDMVPPLITGQQAPRYATPSRKFSRILASRRRLFARESSGSESSDPNFARSRSNMDGWREEKSDGSWLWRSCCTQLPSPEAAGNTQPLTLHLRSATCILTACSGVEGKLHRLDFSVPNCTSLGFS